jgi:phosphatidylglycerol:prolipoprotein diacylglycerol transferase
MYPNFTALPWATSYGVFLITGLALWWWLARVQAKSRELDCSHVDLLAPLIILGGVLGSKFFGVISPNDIQISGDQYIVAGRLRLFGWILMGIVVLAIYCRVHGISFLKTADVFAAPSLLAIGLLRLGCFMGGCCWGDVCVSSGQLAGLNDSFLQPQIHTFGWVSGEHNPLAIEFPAGSFAHQQHVACGLLSEASVRSLPVHPVQIYESILVVALFLVVWFGFPKAGSTHGQECLVALACYSLVRFLIEFFRADNSIILRGLTFTQLICLLALILTPFLWRAISKKGMEKRMENNG